MTVATLRPLSLGETLDASLAVYRRLFTQLLVISFVTQAVPLALGAYVESAGGVLIHYWLWFFATILGLVLGALGTAASTIVVSTNYVGGASDSGAALRTATGYLGRLIALTIAIGLVVGIGLVFLIFPGIILLSGLVLSTPALVIENLQSPTDAMRRSWSLSRGFRGKIFLAYMLGILLLLVPVIAIGWLASMAGMGMEVNAVTVGALGFRIVAALLQILVYPFLYVLATLLYYDMRVRKEGFDLEMLAATLQPA